MGNMIIKISFTDSGSRCFSTRPGREALDNIRRWRQPESARSAFFPSFSVDNINASVSSAKWAQFFDDGTSLVFGPRHGGTNTPHGSLVTAIIFLAPISGSDGFVPIAPFV